MPHGHDEGYAPGVFHNAVSAEPIQLRYPVSCEEEAGQEEDQEV